MPKQGAGLQDSLCSREEMCEKEMNGCLAKKTLQKRLLQNQKDGLMCIIHKKEGKLFANRVLTAVDRLWYNTFILVYYGFLLHSPKI